MVAAKDAHALTTYFLSKYKESIGTPLVVNRNKARWGFEAILMDFSATQARELVDYYLEHYNNPGVDWFLYNYDKVAVDRQEREEQEARAQRLRVETQKRLEDWRSRWETKS